MGLTCLTRKNIQIQVTLLPIKLAISVSIVTDLNPTIELQNHSDEIGHCDWFLGHCCRCGVSL